MKCPNCNQEIDDDSVFCDFCGAKIKQLPSGSGSRPSSMMDTGGWISQAKNIVLIVTAAIFIICVIFFGEYEEGLLAGLSILLSGGLFYWLYASKVSDALKIVLSIVFSITGTIRVIAIYGVPEAFVILLIVEVVVMAIAFYNSTK